MCRSAPPLLIAGYVEWYPVRPPRPIQPGIPFRWMVPLRGRNGTQAVPYGFVQQATIHPTIKKRSTKPGKEGTDVNLRVKKGPRGASL